MINSFYCEKCKLDQDRPSVENGYTLNGESVRWFQGKCLKCNGRIIRYITEKHLDPYFRKSKKIRKQRSEMRKDLIQYGEDGFQTLYGKTYKHFQELEEKGEIRRKAEEKVRDEMYKNFGYDINKRQALDKIYKTN